MNERIFKMLNSVFFNALDILTHSVWRRMAEDSVFVSRQRPEIFLFVCLFVCSVCTSCVAYPASYKVGTKVSSFVLKRPGCEALYSPPSGLGVKNKWRFISISHMSQRLALAHLLASYHFACISCA